MTEFKVGQKYINEYDYPTTCVHISSSKDNTYITLQFSDGSVDTRTNWSGWRKYIEPVKKAMYFNIYPDSISNYHLSRNLADKLARTDRIGCKRVEIICEEGVYDD